MAILGSLPFAKDGPKLFAEFERELEQLINGGAPPKAPAKIAPNNLLAMLLKSGVKVSRGE